MATESVRRRVPARDPSSYLFKDEAWITSCRELGLRSPPRGPGLGDLSWHCALAWICARTPNRWGPIALPAQVVPNKGHDRVLAVVQPEKQTRDTFPTAYQLNTRSALLRHFPLASFEHHSYTYESEPAYVGRSQLAWSVAVGVSQVIPQHFRSMLMIFLRKREDAGSAGASSTA